MDKLIDACSLKIQYDCAFICYAFLRKCMNEYL